MWRHRTAKSELERGYGPTAASWCAADWKETVDRGGVSRCNRQALAGPAAPSPVSTSRGLHASGTRVLRRTCRGRYGI